MCVCPPPRLLITSGMIWSPYDWLNNFYSFYVAAVVVIDDGYGLTVKAHRINQPIIRVSYRCISRYFHFNITFKQLYTSNKM